MNGQVLSKKLFWRNGTVSFLDLLLVLDTLEAFNKVTSITGITWENVPIRELEKSKIPKEQVVRLLKINNESKSEKVFITLVEKV